MNRDHRNHAIVGAFVFAMVGALLVWLALLSGRTGPTDPYFIVYDDVMGLKAGSRIYFQGFPVGLIDDIAPVEREGRRSYRVDVQLRRNWPVPDDSIAKIVSGLFSAVVVDIRAGRSEVPIPVGGEIPGQEAADVFARLGDVAGELDALIDERVAPLLGDVGEHAPRILTNLESLTADLRIAASQVNAVLEPSNIERVQRTLENLEATSGSLRTVSADLRATRSNVDSALARVNELLDEDEGEITRSLEDLQHSLATVARHIDAISQNLEGASRNMNEFSRQIRENPGLLVRGRAAGDGDAP